MCVADHNGILKSEFYVLNNGISLTSISKNYYKTDADSSYC